MAFSVQLVVRFRALFAWEIFGVDLETHPSFCFDHSFLVVVFVIVVIFAIFLIFLTLAI
jgi:hypothetical protein